MNAPRTPLKSLDQALAELLAQALPLAGTETVSTFDADGRVLAQDLVSALHVPPQDNSSMDGYALRCADVPAAGTVLRVTQRIPAGQHGQPLKIGEAARIFTGAPVPAGADAIVMQEDCEVVEEGRVRVNSVPDSGQWIRRAGEDVTRGAVVLARGQRLNPAALGMAAGIGQSQLTVARARVWPCSPPATNSSCPVMCRPSKCRPAPSTTPTVFSCAPCCSAWVAKSPTSASCRTSVPPP